MYPSLNLIKSHCEVSPIEERLLLSPESPIMLLKRKLGTHEESNPSIAEAVAPGNPYLGIMLPYTPLHHILMVKLNSPIVATSGNISDEPICINEQEALERLGKIVDFFMVHNRPIARHVDDSIVRVVLDRQMVLRRARGYAPLPIYLRKKVPTILAVGAHLKNTVALSVENQIFISQHIGDLETDAAFQAFQNVIQSFKELYDSEPESIACDAHPDYLSTQYALKQNRPVQKIQHHYAHVIACMLENELEPPVLGVSWDGTGYGLDNTVWGGEFFHITEDNYYRIAHFRQFPLPGGELAIKEPRRAAIGLLHEMDGHQDHKNLSPLKAFSNKELSLLKTMLDKKINSPKTSSAGRLFDAVASLLDLRQINRFEGQAAMELEFQLNDTVNHSCYEFQIRNQKNIGNSNGYLVDWELVIQQLLRDKENQIPVNEISQKFHNTLSEIVVEIAKKVKETKVLLSGGCFQNRYLTEYTVKRLKEENFHPYWHQRIPPNDGGIAVGQIGAVISNRKYDHS
jgi:hydrogenase maturation protein HypF